MNEATYEGNHSQLSLICRIFEKSTGTIENHFLDLLNLSCCDAETIFRRVESFLDDNKLDIICIRFARMDGCLTMSGEHNGVNSIFEKITSHFTHTFIVKTITLHCVLHILSCNTLISKNLTVFC